MSLRELIRQFKWIHKPISCIFNYFIYPVQNGYYFFMIKYLFCIKCEEFKALRNYGFKDIKPFKTRAWRIGTEKDHAHRRYYTAIHKGTKCFIKVALNDSTIGNEIAVAEQLKDKDISFISKIIVIDSNFSGNKQVLATAFTLGLHPISEESVYNDVEVVSPSKLLIYCKQMKSILQTLEELKLVHADIHKGNLMLDANDNLILLDFGISKFLDKDNDVQYRYRPGTFYRDTAEGRVYDDAYSFISLINRYDTCQDIKHTDEYKAICDRINKVTFTVKI